MKVECLYWLKKNLEIERDHSSKIKEKQRERGERGFFSPSFSVRCIGFVQCRLRVDGSRHGARLSQLESFWVRERERGFSFLEGVVREKKKTIVIIKLKCK